MCSSVFSFRFSWFSPPVSSSSPPSSSSDGYAGLLDFVEATVRARVFSLSSSLSLGVARLVVATVRILVCSELRFWVE